MVRDKLAPKIYKNKYFDFAIEFKYLQNMEIKLVLVVPIDIRVIGTVLEKRRKRLEGIENQRKTWNR